MARMKKGILGGVSGKVGSVVGGRWNGIDYVRSLPTSVNQSKSALQLSQREKFRTVVRFLQPVNDIVKIGFKSYANEMSAFNAAFSWNFHNALLGDEINGYEMDYAKARLSMGGLSSLAQLALQAGANASVDITWSDNSGIQNAQGSDSLYYVVINPLTRESVFQLNAARRDEGELTLNLPVLWSGQMVEVMLGFISLSSFTASNNRKGVSDTFYAGQIVLV